MKQQILFAISVNITHFEIPAGARGLCYVAIWKIETAISVPQQDGYSAVGSIPRPTQSKVKLAITVKISG
jgi:hypothetical protein